MADKLKKSGKAPAETASQPVEVRGAGADRHPLMSLRDEMDRLFDEFASGFSLSPFRRRMLDFEPFRRFETAMGASVPSVDVVEKDKQFEITAELPGMDEKDVELTVSDDLLTIKGEKKEEKEEKKEGYHLSERRYGSFQRAFRLPDTVDQDKIDAHYEKGVLTVVLPKTKAAKKEARKIGVKAK